MLKAVPRQGADKAEYGKIDVLLEGKTYMTFAIQVWSPNGKERTVFQFEQQKVNQRPSDRDQLIAPDLARLQMVSTLPDRSTRLSADAMAIREVLDAVPDIDHHVLRIRLEHEDGEIEVWTGTSRGPLDGGGNILRLRKADGKWKIIEKNFWVS